MIRAAVRRLIEQGGCDSVTVRKIAKTSGFAVQSIYNLIGTKDDVICGAISEYADFCSKIGRSVQNHPDDLLSLIFSWSRAVSECPRFVREVNRMYFNGSRGLYYKFRDQEVQSMKKLLRNKREAGVLRSDVDPDVVGGQFSFYVSALLIEWVDRPFSADDFRIELLQMFKSLLLDKFSPHQAERIEYWLKQFGNTSPTQRARLS